MSDMIEPHRSNRGGQNCSSRARTHCRCRPAILRPRTRAAPAKGGRSARRASARGRSARSAPNKRARDPRAPACRSTGIWRAGFPLESSFGFARCSLARGEVSGVANLHRSGPGVNFVLLAGEVRIGVHFNVDPEPVLQSIDEVAGGVV